MAGTKPANKGPRQGKADVFTEEERAAMKEAVRERRRADKGDGAADLIEKIAEMPEPDRSMAERLHEIVTNTAPDLTPRTWYGMPAYALNGKVVCFFQSAAKFKSRYPTLGFSDQANLDEGSMWPTAFALTEMNATNEAKIEALLKKAVG